MYFIVDFTTKQLVITVLLPTYKVVMDVMDQNDNEYHVV